MMTKEKLLSMTFEQRKSFFDKNYVCTTLNKDYFSDGFTSYDCEENIGCSDCYQTSSSTNCKNCYKCYELRNCVACFDCYKCSGITGGTHQKFVYYGIQLTEEEYDFVVAGKHKVEKPSCVNKEIIIEGKKYKLVEVK